MNTNKWLNITLGAAIFTIVLALIMLGKSYVTYYSSINVKQIEEITQLQTEVPEIIPFVQEANEDNMITNQEYEHIISVKNEIVRRKLFK